MTIMACWLLIIMCRNPLLEFVVAVVLTALPCLLSTASQDLKEKAIANYGDPHKFIVKENRLLRHLEPDYKQLHFTEIPFAAIAKFALKRSQNICNATVLNAVAKSLPISAMLKLANIKLEVYDVVSKEVNS